MKAHPTDVECPTCHAWVGWACEGRGYGYHAAGYHRSRQRAAEALAIVRALVLVVLGRSFRPHVETGRATVGAQRATSTATSSRDQWNST